MQSMGMDLTYARLYASISKVASVGKLHLARAILALGTMLVCSVQFNLKKDGIECNF